MNILITGGFGYLGGRLSNFLKEKGHEVTILSRRIPKELIQWSKSFRIIEADIASPHLLKGTCQNQDVVVHAAAVKEVICAKDSYQALLVNGYGTRNMLEEAKRAGIELFVYLSTFHVYGHSAGDVIDETVCPNPIHDYAITHRLAEMYCLQFRETHGLKSVVLRISNGYGAPVHKSVNRWTLAINEFCRMAFEQKKITLRSSGTQERDFVAIPDICQAIDLIIQKRDQLRHFIYNVGGQNPCSILQIARLVATVYEERYGSEIEIEVPSQTTSVDYQKVTFNINRLQDLGFVPKGNMRQEIHAVFNILED